MCTHARTHASALGCVSLAVRSHAFVPLAFFFPLLPLRLRGLMLRRVSALLASQEVSSAVWNSVPGRTMIGGHGRIQGHSNWLPGDLEPPQWPRQLPRCIVMQQPVRRSRDTARRKPFPANLWPSEWFLRERLKVDELKIYNIGRFVINCRSDPTFYFCVGCHLGEKGFLGCLNLFLSAVPQVATSNELSRHHI